MDSIVWKDIIREAKEDSSIFETLDVDGLLDMLENEQVDYLENKTMEIVTREVYNKIKSMRFTKNKIAHYCEKLAGYRLVNQVFELRKSRSIKAFKIFDEKTGMTIENPTLLAGLLVNIKFLNGGTYLLYKNLTGRFFNLKFDNCVIFQKLTEEEQLILLAYDHISKEDEIEVEEVEENINGIYTRR